MMINVRRRLRTCQNGTPTQLKSEGVVSHLFVPHCGAMELEPNIAGVADGTRVDVVARVNYVGAGFSSLTTTIHQVNLFVDVRIPNAGLVTLFGMRKLQVSNQCWIMRTAETTILEHHVKDVNIIPTVTEVCSGISAVSTGYEACGAEVTMHCDNNPIFAQWLHEHGKQVVLGDIADPAVVASLSTRCCGILSGGIACQPRSKLGDEQHMQDPRSRSLPGMLRALHLLQVPMAIMECTEAVQQSKEAQSMFKMFASQTGMVIQQTTLPLHTIWPARRTRWWATISKPCLGLHPIPALPALAFEPTLIHLFPHFLELSEQDLQQLTLDGDEMDQFLSTPKGMYEHQVKQLKPLPTATHSWGSQLRGCECGCRKSGFSEHRIKTKGLYGQLLPLSATCTKDGQTVQQMRHLHAAEVALANGLHPKHLGLHNKSARLALAAVGQLASPFHSAWILANAMKDMNQAGILPGPTSSPIDIMKQHAKMLLHQRDELLGIRSYTESMQRFHMAIELWGQPEASEMLKAMTFAPAAPLPGDDSKPSQVAYVAQPPASWDTSRSISTQAQEEQSSEVKSQQDLSFQHSVFCPNEKNKDNSQRLGRKDPLREEEDNQQPANQTQGLGQNGKQPAEKTQRLPPPMVFQAKPQMTSVTAGPTHPDPQSRLREGDPDHPASPVSQMNQVEPAQPGATANQALPLQQMGSRLLQQAGTTLALSFQHSVYLSHELKKDQNSQRMGRQNPLSDEEIEKQPANQTQELGQNIQQPAVETQRLPPPMFLQAMPQVTTVPVGPTPPNADPNKLKHPASSEVPKPGTHLPEASVSSQPDHQHSMHSTQPLRPVSIMSIAMPGTNAHHVADQGEKAAEAPSSFVGNDVYASSHTTNPIGERNNIASKQQGMQVIPTVQVRPTSKITKPVRPTSKRENTYPTMANGHKCAGLQPNQPGLQAKGRTQTEHTDISSTRIQLTDQPADHQQRAHTNTVTNHPAGMYQEPDEEALLQAIVNTCQQVE